MSRRRTFRERAYLYLTLQNIKIILQLITLLEFTQNSEFDVHLALRLFAAAGLLDNVRASALGALELSTAGGQVGSISVTLSCFSTSI